MDAEVAGPCTDEHLCRLAGGWGKRARARGRFGGGADTAIVRAPQRGARGEPRGYLLNDSDPSGNDGTFTPGACRATGLADRPAPLRPAVARRWVARAVPAESIGIVLIGDCNSG